jgi:hypothetical protein
MSKEKDAREAELLALAQADPVFQALYKQWQAATPTQIGRGGKASDPYQTLAKQLHERFKQIVAKAGGDPNYDIQFNGRNGFTVDHQNVLERHPELVPAIVGGALTGGVLALPALGVGGAAGGGSAAAGGGAAVGGGTAATVAGAAGTGGSVLGKVLTAADIAQDIGGIADRYNTRRADDQTAQANYNIDYDRNAIGRYGAELNASQQQLDRRKYADDAYQQALSDRIYGSALQGVQDTTISAPAGIRMGQITGGLRPSMIGNRGAVGSELETNARDRMQHPTPLPDLPSAPDLSATGLDQSKLDSLMDWLGLAGGAAGNAADIYGRLRPPQRSTQPAGAPTTLPDLPSWSSSANMYPGGVNPYAPPTRRYY